MSSSHNQEFSTKTYESWQTDVIQKIQLLESLGFKFHSSIDLKHCNRTEFKVEELDCLGDVVYGPNSEDNLCGNFGLTKNVQDAISKIESEYSNEPGPTVDN